MNIAVCCVAIILPTIQKYRFTIIIHMIPSTLNIDNYRLVRVDWQDYLRQFVVLHDMHRQIVIMASSTTEL